MKTCNNCKWLHQQICENTNWKDGKLQLEAAPPGCGYFKNGTTPIGWEPIKACMRTEATDGTHD